MATRRKLDVEATNAVTLAEMLVDPDTPPALQVRILNKLLTGIKHANFFETIYESSMSVGECPKCGHQNHWLVPEGELNQMGYVTSEQDERVKRETSQRDCSKFAEACMKKKINA